MRQGRHHVRQGRDHVRIMCAKVATMCAKDATMCAKDATMCAKDATMCGMDATMCVKGCDHVRMVGFALMNEFEDPQILEGQGQSRRRLTYPVASYTNSRAALDRLRAYALRDLPACHPPPTQSITYDTCTGGGI